FWKSGPCRGPPSPSPGEGGASILITRAPQSASWRTAVGPARTRVRSSTVKRASGGCGSGIGVALRKHVRRGLRRHAPARTSDIRRRFVISTGRCAKQNRGKKKPPRGCRGGSCLRANPGLSRPVLREDDLDPAVLRLAHTIGSRHPVVVLAA